MSKKNKNHAFVNVDDVVVNGNEKIEINDNPSIFTKVNTESQKHETIITAPKEEMKEEIKEEKKEEPVEEKKELFTPVVEEKEPAKEEVKEQPKKRVVAVPCVTKNVKAVDLIAQQHGYAVNINLPRI